MRQERKERAKTRKVQRQKIKSAKDENVKSFNLKFLARNNEDSNFFECIIKTNYSLFYGTVTHDICCRMDETEDDECVRFFQWVSADSSLMRYALSVELKLPA